MELRSKKMTNVRTNNTYPILYFDIFYISEDDGCLLHYSGNYPIDYDIEYDYIRDFQSV